MLPTARAAMEYCWLYPWIVVLGGGAYGGAGPLLGPGWAFLLMVGAQIAVRPVLDHATSLRQARTALIALGLALGLAALHQEHYPVHPFVNPVWLGALLREAHDTLPGIPRPVLAALLAACLWWRGLALGARETDAMAIEEAYKVGVGAILLYFLTAAIYAGTAGFEAAGPTLPASLPAFFFLGLSALALARLAIIWERGQPDERAHFPARVWVLVVVGVMGMILLAAGMTAGLAAADVVTYLGLALRPLLPVVEMLFVVVFFVAEILVRIIVAILDHLPRREPLELQPAPTVFDDLLRRLREVNMHPQVVEGARWAMVAAVVALLVLGMALTVVLMRRRERKPDEDERESVWSAQDALKALAGLLPRLRLRRSGGDEPPEGSVRAVRRFYRELLRIGSDLGVPRHPSATPREHGPRLRSVLPEAAEDVAVLTESYERVRYGGWTPPAADVRAAEGALRRVRATLPAETASGGA